MYLAEFNSLQTAAILKFPFYFLKDTNIFMNGRTNKQHKHTHVHNKHLILCDQQCWIKYQLNSTVLIHSKIAEMSTLKKFGNVEEGRNICFLVVKQPPSHPLA